MARKDVQIFDPNAVVTPTTAYVVFEPRADTTTPQVASETPVRPEITLGAVALELVRRGGTTATGERDSRDLLRVASPRADYRPLPD